MRFFPVFVMLAMPLAACSEPTTKSLAWMVGCWASEGAEVGSGENWYAPMPGLLVGISRTMRNGEVRWMEVMNISETNEGIRLTAIPTGQQPATFTAVDVSESKVVFENPTHDFPQRIIYMRDGATRMTGRIEGQTNGKERSVEFPLIRIDCASKEAQILRHSQQEKPAGTQ